jgi:hypothetical protein
MGLIYLIVKTAQHLRGKWRGLKQAKSPDENGAFRSNALKKLKYIRRKVVELLQGLQISLFPSVLPGG